MTKTGKQKLFSVLISSIFICTIIGLVLVNKLPIYILYFYIVVSLLTFGLYAKDKSAAQKGKWRTPESTLHLFALVGGWPGAAIAQSQLRHKSIKMSFRVVYWFTVIINCSILGWLLTSGGVQWLDILIKKFNS